MKVNLKSEELDLVIKALNFVYESADYDLNDKEESETWLYPWLKDLNDHSEKAGKLLDLLAEQMDAT